MTLNLKTTVPALAATLLMTPLVFAGGSSSLSDSQASASQSSGVMQDKGQAADQGQAKQGQAKQGQGFVSEPSQPVSDACYDSSSGYDLNAITHVNDIGDLTNHRMHSLREGSPVSISGRYLRRHGDNGFWLRRGGADLLIFADGFNDWNSFDDSEDVYLTGSYYSGDSNLCGDSYYGSGAHIIATGIRYGDNNWHGRHSSFYGHDRDHDYSYDHDDDRD